MFHRGASPVTIVVGRAREYDSSRVQFVSLLVLTRCSSLGGILRLRFVYPPLVGRRAVPV